MSTRSNIAVEHCNGTVSDVYCHSDGYLSEVGTTLFKYWASTSKLRSLIMLGDISSLGDHLGDTNAYHRDKGEELTTARKHFCVSDYINKSESATYRSNWGYEYLYLFSRSKGWLVKVYDEPWKPLYLALVEDKLTNED